MLTRSSNSRCRLALVAFAVLSLGLVTQVQAWEGDTHYGLTRWLAIKAGFSPRHAEIIAAWDLKWDEGNFGPATWDSLYVIALGSEQASRTIRIHHFPTNGPVPGRPEDRIVEPNGPYARTLVLNALNLPVNDLEELLREFGTSLHPFEDSWAHQGIPDTPFLPFWTPRRNLTWGHPQARGGWRKHDADLTYLYPDDTVKMAEETYRFLCAFLDKHDQKFKLRVTQPLPWQLLEPQVRSFARARTKLEKLQWFRDDPGVPLTEYGKREFLRHISLPGRWSEIERDNTFLSSEPQPVILQPASYHPSPSRGNGSPYIAIEIESDLQSTAKQFLNSWLIAQDIDETMSFVDGGEITKQLRHLKAGKTNADQWARKFLAMWLVEDHGLVNDKGHGFPLDQGYKDLPASRERSGEFIGFSEGEGLDEKIGIPENLGGNEPYWLGKMHTSWFPFFRPHGLFFYFRELQHDGVLIIFKKKHGKWRVSRMLWVVQ